jgi:hypothetical protein
MSKKIGRPTLDPREKKDVQVTVRLKSSTVAALEKAARLNGVPLAREITTRLEDTLESNLPDQLFGGPKTYAFALLLALSLKQLRTLTGHWWHEDRFTFDHAKSASDVLFEYCKPPGAPIVPDDLPRLPPGTVRRASGGLPYPQSRFGAEAAKELIEAMEQFSGKYGVEYERFAHLLPEPQREASLFNKSIYTRLGRSLIPLHERAGPQIAKKRRAKR